MSADVALKSLLVLSSVLTQIASLGPLVRVAAKVNCQISYNSKFCATLLANIWPLPSVRTHVVCQMPAHSEGCRADRALVWARVVVYALVFCEIALGCEASVTSGTSERLLASMATIVLLQLAWNRKSLPTHVAAVLPDGLLHARHC